MATTPRTTEDLNAVFKAMDARIAKIHEHACEPAFSREHDYRSGLQVNLSAPDTEVLRGMCHLIAYSQAARASAVEDALPVLDEAFAGYEPDSVAGLDPDEVKRRFWHRLGALRFRSKVDRMVRAAQVLVDIARQHGSFMNLLDQAGLPHRLSLPTHISQFWFGFERIQGQLDAHGMPFFPRLTSLCHLLKDAGYPCLKPDSGVMAASAKLGVFEGGSMYRDTLRRDVVTVMQRYALSRNVPMAVLDMYLLILGDMTWARQFVKSHYYGRQAAE